MIRGQSNDPGTVQKTKKGIEKGKGVSPRPVSITLLRYWWRNKNQWTGPGLVLVWHQKFFGDYAYIKTLDLLLVDAAEHFVENSIVNAAISEVVTSLADDMDWSWSGTKNLPSNSDAVLILSQFEAALDAFKGKYHGFDEDRKLRWFTKENPN